MIPTTVAVLITAVEEVIVDPHSMEGSTVVQEVVFQVAQEEGSPAEASEVVEAPLVAVAHHEVFSL